MTKTIRDLLILGFLTLFCTGLVWLPHIFRLGNFYGMDFSRGMATIYRNYDGIEYVIIAKTFYNPRLLSVIPQSLTAAYYASHFPGYSLVILIFAPFMGFLRSMLFTSLLFTLLSIASFYLMVQHFKLTRQPLWLATLFLILPARWLVVHSVGSSEPMFISFTILTLFLFMKFEQTNRIIWIILAGLSGVLLQLARPPAILLFVALFLYVHWTFFQQIKTDFKSAFLKHLRFFPLAFIPLTLLSIFRYFQLSLGDFWAYFHSGDNIHLTLPPFLVFNQSQSWVGTIWLEDVIYIYILGLLAGLLLFKQKLYLLSFFVLIYLLAVISVAHRDIARYSLPIFPFVLIAYEKILITREFKIVFAVVALAIYLYAQNFILGNTAPIPNIEVFN